MTPTPLIPSKPDLITTAIEVIGRSGRWLLEAAFCCIIGVILFSQLGVVLTLLSALTSLELKNVNNWLPAVGWWVGFGIGLLRLQPCLRKPFLQAISDDGSEADAAAPIQVSPAAASSRTIRVRGTAAGKRASVCGLIGLIAGLFLSIYLCVITTAAFLSPIAPQSWKTGMQVGQLERDSSIHDPNRHHKSDDGTVGATFWHPAFAPIILSSLVGGLGIGIFAGACVGWHGVEND